MHKNKKITILSSIVILSVWLSGCGLFGLEDKQKMDPPNEASYTSDASKISTEETTKDNVQKEQKVVAENTIETELYLLDKNGYVVPQTLNLPKTNSVAKQALDYLIQDGKVTDILPNGFKAVIPADTNVSVKIDKDKVATVNFSKEFNHYKKEEEQKILQSVTWTLTQFDSIEKVKIQVNGFALKEMPVNKTPIAAEGLTRADGINIDTTDVLDITNTKSITVYYLGGEDEHYYYVPVTKRVSNKEEDNIQAAVDELIKGPSYTSYLLSDFSAEAKLLDEPKVEDGKVTLNFNKSIVNSLNGKKISQHVLEALALSLTEQKGIESVALTVDGKTDLLNEKGEKITKPVTRPEKVNTGSF
ncbi:GerMN domain-containing protein [Cytobacillus sp. Hz8]|uniref:GerMN domain-containing protein n=1 Tax=Cytobacillus sp. Hz8 TaxID=3347168 RepID=UPI0035E386A1